MIFPSSPIITPFSSSATSNRGMAAHVPLSVCAKGIVVSALSERGRCRICSLRAW